jgi:lantibiotic modifying enzyme
MSILHLPEPTLNCQFSLSVCSEIAESLVNPEFVKNIVTHVDNKNPLFNEPPWYPNTLSHGYPAILLFYSYIAQSPLKFSSIEKIIYDYILCIRQDLTEQGVKDFSLYTGLAGICYSLSNCIGIDPRYSTLLETLDRLLIQGLEEFYFPAIHTKLLKAEPISTQLYDVIQGIIGIGAYLLTKPSNPEFHKALTQIAKYLVGMCKPIKVNQTSVPGWYLPTEYQFLEQDRLAYPKGNFNLGLAHGITGNLSFLALLKLKGIEVDNHAESMEYITKWLLAYQQKGPKGSFWPKRISFEHYIEGSIHDGESIRDAWCYGSPGIANALFLSSKALNRPDWTQKSLDILYDALQRSPMESDIWRPTFCHGIAGLLTITFRIARLNSDPFLLQKTQSLKQLLLSFYDEAAPFRFRDREPMPSGGQIQLNKAGLLEGACGVGLALLSLNTDYDIPWDEPFLTYSRDMVL